MAEEGPDLKAGDSEPVFSGKGKDAVGTGHYNLGTISASP